MVRGLLSLAVVSIGMTWPTASRAQVDNDTYMALLYEVSEIVNGVSEKTARDSHQACVNYVGKIDGMAQLDNLQRSYLRAQGAGCIAYAMNNGQFSDATGDQCSWQYDYAELLVETLAITKTRSELADVQETIRNDLDQAIRTAGMISCKQDFEALNKQ